MGLFDNFFEKVGLGDDFEEYDNDVDYDYEQEKRSSSYNKQKRQESTNDRASKQAGPTKASSRGSETSRSGSYNRANPKVTPIGRSQKKWGNDLRIVSHKPVTIEESKNIIDCLLNGEVALMNLEGLDFNLAHRIMDLCCGACYALDATVKQLSKSMYIAAPGNVEIDGVLMDLNDGRIDLNGFSREY